MLVMKKRMIIAQRIDFQLLIQAWGEVNYWWNVLKLVVAVVRRLVTAGLPLRGHFKRLGSLYNCGNFITSYLSSTYKEFLKLRRYKVTEKILTEIKAKKYFSLVVNSTPDISYMNQLA